MALKTPQFQFDDPANIGYDHNLYYTGLKAAGDANAVTADPLLRAAGTGADGRSTLQGYQLKAGSPAIASGVSFL
ncbi:MAG TPA: hypothetical protein VF421_11750 [Niabella sp.]